MAQERKSYFIMLNSTSIVRDTDERDSPFFDLYCDRACTGIDRIFDQFLYNGTRSIDYLTGRNLINCFLI